MPSTTDTISHVFWRRLGDGGLDAATLVERRDRTQIIGTALFVEAGVANRADYQIACAADWTTSSARVLGRSGDSPVDVTIVRDAAGAWTLNGVHQPEVDGCVDFDIAISPATNTLSIRRLEWPLDVEHLVPVAWLQWPTPRLRRLVQRYRRVAPDRFAYEADVDEGLFACELTVDQRGLVLRYGDLWAAVGSPSESRG